MQTHIYVKVETSLYLEQAPSSFEEALESSCNAGDWVPSSFVSPGDLFGPDSGIKLSTVLFWGSSGLYKVCLTPEGSCYYCRPSGRACGVSSPDAAAGKLGGGQGFST